MEYIAKSFSFLSRADAEFVYVTSGVYIQAAAALSLIMEKDRERCC